DFTSPILTAGGKLFAVRAEGHGGDRPGGSAEDMTRRSRDLGGPYHYHAIRPAAGDPLAVRAERPAVHRLSRHVQEGALAPRHRIPEKSSSVEAGRNHLLTVRADRQSVDLAPVPVKRKGILAVSGIPDTDRPVLTPRGQALAVGA